MIKHLVLLVLAIASLYTARQASAHSMPQSTVQIDIGSAAVRVEATLPLAELELALPTLWLAEGRRLREAQHRLLIDYGSRHIGVEGAGGERWVLDDAAVSLELSADHRDVIYRAVYLRPHGKSPPMFRLRYDAITHEVMSHVVLFYIRGDLTESALEREPEFIGMLQNPIASINVAIVSQRSQGFFTAAFRIGVRHILEGYDHILFLLSVVLVLPLAVASEGWNGRKSARQTLLALTKVVTAFTLGHTATLLLVVMFDWQLPTALIELCVAATVLAAAINIWRPVLAHKEALVAGLFGLVHGMAFSGAISQHLLDPMLKLQVVLGFNLGVEAVQLVLASAVIIPVWAMVPHSKFIWFRALASTLIAAAASYWIIERVPPVSDELAAIADLSEPGRMGALVLLVTVALLALIAVHIGAIKKENLVAPMVSGKKVLHPTVLSPRMGSAWAFALCVLAVALLSWWIAAGAPTYAPEAPEVSQFEEPPPPMDHEDFY